MYNVSEQFAELNQANVAQATKLSALALENADKLAKINLQTAMTVVAMLKSGCVGDAAHKRKERARGIGEGADSLSV